MTFWHVVTKFFDSGKVKVNLAPIEADCKPENHMSENKTCDEYHNYFDTYEEAVAYHLHRAHAVQQERVYGRLLRQ